MELYPHCSMFTFQGTPVPTFQLGPRTPPTILKCACDELCCGMCAVLCRLVASTRCQRRCALAVQVSGFNWALFTWQGTRGATSAARMLGWCSGAVESAVRLLHPYDTAFRTGLQVLLDHNILCFSAENSAFSPVRAQYIVVARKNSYFSQKTA